MSTSDPPGIYSGLDQLPTLETSRLRLRHLRQSDLDALYTIFSDPPVMRYWSRPPKESPSEAQELLEQIWQGFADRQLFQWGIALAEDDQVIGTCTLYRLMRQHRRADIGFALGSAWQGQGYAFEAVSRVIRHAVEALDVAKLEADVDPRNQPSLRLLEKLGFEREGLLRGRYRIAGEIQDSVMLGWWTEELRGQLQG